MSISLSAEERFWYRVKKGAECWEWQGAAHPYGQLMVDGKPMRTHRFSYQLAYGDIPAGMAVCHRCDNPRCVRPDHLFLGSRRDNLRDAKAKGRWWSRRKCVEAYTDTNQRIPRAVEPEHRFWAQVAKSEGCWHWKGHIARTGYGSFRLGGRGCPQILAHRAAWLLTHGKIPAGLLVCHHCDNRACVRPDHLFLGTHQDNTQDCLRKGRRPKGVYPDRRGSKASSAKLTESDIPHIRRRGAAGEVAASIAPDYNVCRRQIHNILTGKQWQHVE